MRQSRTPILAWGAARRDGGRCVTLTILLGFISPTDLDSNYRMVLGRAYKSMKEYPDVLERIEDAVRIKNIGPKIISKLKEKQKEKTGFMSAHLNLPSMAGPSTSTATEPAPKKRGRPKKADGSTATPLNRQVSAPSVMNTSSSAKATYRARQASGTAAVEAAVEHAPPPGAPLTDSDPFLFTYLGEFAIHTSRLLTNPTS